MSLLGYLINKTPVGEAIRDKVDEVRYTTRAGQVADDLIEGAKTGAQSVERVGRTLINAHDSLRLESYLRKYIGFEAKNLKEGDHLWVQRIGYTHHGIYIGDGEVIHYLQEGVTMDSLETFADGSKVYKRDSFDSPAKFSRSEIVDRAMSRLGDDNYNVVINNCEHFCRWCRNGR